MSSRGLAVWPRGSGGEQHLSSAVFGIMYLQRRLPEGEVSDRGDGGQRCDGVQTLMWLLINAVFTPTQ